MSTNMGNLEKLGILVIVILVVVVGVVAITPKSTVDDRLYQEETAVAPATEPEALTPPGDPTKPKDVWPLPANGSDPAPGSGPGAGTGPVDPNSTVVVPPAAAAPAFRTMKVKKGDTLALIAKRELGSATRYQEILDANPGLVATKMKIGAELKIPVASAATAAVPVPNSPVVTAPPVPNGPSVVGPAPEAAGERTYVVKSGDTLSSIAGRELGATKRWTEIAKLNESLLHGSTNLKIGMKLALPGASGSSGSMMSGDPAPTATPAPADAMTGDREYTVKAGDSLWLIAKNEMGSESFVKELRAANTDVLNGSEALKVGAKLRIPAKH